MKRQRQLLQLHCRHHAAPTAARHEPQRQPVAGRQWRPTHPSRLQTRLPTRLPTHLCRHHCAPALKLRHVIIKPLQHHRRVHCKRGAADAWQRPTDRQQLHGGRGSAGGRAVGRVGGFNHMHASQASAAAAAAAAAAIKCAAADRRHVALAALLLQLGRQRRRAPCASARCPAWLAPTSCRRQRWWWGAGQASPPRRPA